MTTPRYLWLMATISALSLLISCELFQIDPATGVRPIVPIVTDGVAASVENPTAVGVVSAVSTAVVTGVLGWLAIRRRNAKRAAAGK